jgi:hypothetical protein
MWRAWRLMRAEAENPDAASMARWGGRIAALPTILQLPIGIWLVLELPESTQSEFMGGSVATSSLFAASLVAALWLMHQLSAVAMGNVKPRTLIHSMVSMTVVVLLMTGTLRAAKASRQAETGRAACKYFC